MTRDKTPMLVAMKGPPDAGKSTLARAVSQQLGWPLIDKDDIKDILDGHTPQAGAVSYEVMVRVVRRQALQGLSVVCDSPLLKQTYDGLRGIAHDAGSSLAVVACRCTNEAIWRARIQDRERRELAPHHTTTWEAVQRFLAQPGVDYAITDPHRIVDTIRPLSEIVDDVLVWLSSLDPHQV